MVHKPPVERATVETPWVAASAATRRLLERADRMARLDAPILVQGERGTGKTILVERIVRGAAARAPYQHCNCATFAGALADSALFGHVAGAFTDAKHGRRGALELADGGTLFLDEIGDLPLDVQAKLLVALESGWIQRLGAEDHTRVRFRLIAATNLDLDAMVAAGRFRADLLDRIGAIRLVIPPLRERPEDILAIARRYAGLELHADSERWLLTRRWDGNARTLEQAVTSAGVLARLDGARTLTLAHLLEVREHEPAAELPSERDRIVAALLGTGDNRTRAARLLNLSTSALRRAMRAHGVDIPGRPGRPPRSR